MESGIRATVEFQQPGECPLAEFSRKTGEPITQVSTSVATPEVEASVTEFLSAGELPEGVDAEPIFSYGNATVFRTTHDQSERCPCECLGSYGCPIHRYHFDDGAVTLVFHVKEFETLQDIFAELRETYAPVDVQKLLRPPLEGSPEERVFVNRGRLTERQLDVLRTAYEMGYFERPKHSNATEVAEALGITQSTFTEHLVAAQRKLLEDVLD